MIKFINGPSCSGKTFFFDKYKPKKNEVKVTDLLRNKIFIGQIKADKNNIFEWQKELYTNLVRWIVEKANDEKTYIVDGGANPINGLIFADVLQSTNAINVLQFHELINILILALLKFKDRIAFYNLDKVDYEVLLHRLKKRNEIELTTDVFMKKYFEIYYKSLNYFMSDYGLNKLTFLPISKL